MSDDDETLQLTTIRTEEGVEGALDHSIPRLTILHHPDGARVGHRSWLNDPGGGTGVRLSRTHPAFGPPGAPDDRPLGVAHLSRRPISLRLSTAGGVGIAAPADATPLRVDGRRLVGETELEAEAMANGIVLELANRVVLLLHSGPMPQPIDDDMGLVGCSPALAEVREQIARVAAHDVPVLVRGESGTGKELVASAIHRQSPRRSKPYVSVNMAALVPTTAAAALFGHDKGAFTGATRASLGFYGQADGGTLFLDEIGETPAEVQPVLLRALESGEIQKLGSDRTEHRDVRLIAATDADLDAAAADGTFRLPLLQRLQGYVVHLPALRERREDIGVLLHHFLRRALRELGREDRLDVRDHGAKPWLPAVVVSRAMRYHWPGNVRELRNLARKLVIDFAEREHVTMSPALEAMMPVDGDGDGDGDDGDDVSPLPAAARPSVKPSQLTDDELLDVLRAHDFRPQAAAEALGVSRTTLYAAIEQSDRIRKAADLSADEIQAAIAATSGDVAAAARSLEVSSRGLRLRMKRLGLT